MGKGRWRARAAGGGRDGVAASRAAAAGRAVAAHAAAAGARRRDAGLPAARRSGGVCAPLWCTPWHRAANGTHVHAPQPPGMLWPFAIPLAPVQERVWHTAHAHVQGVARAAPACFGSGALTIVAEWHVCASRGVFGSCASVRAARHSARSAARRARRSCRTCCSPRGRRCARPPPSPLLEVHCCPRQRPSHQERSSGTAQGHCDAVVAGTPRSHHVRVQAWRAR